MVRFVFPQPLPRFRTVVVVASAIAAAACASDSTGVGRSGSSQLTFSASAAHSASASVAPVTVGGHTLDLATVTLTISRAELKRASSDACPGDEGDDDHPPSTTTSSASSEACGELKVGPTTVDLPVSGTLVTVPANVIPAGTYREFELRFSTVELKGTYDAKPFDVTLPVSARNEIEFSTPLVVTDGTPAAITVNVATGGWLVNADGSLIDPSRILTTPSLLTQVTSRITASFHAFEDRDHDGRDDHGGR